MNITLISLFQTNIYTSLLFSGSNSFRVHKSSFDRSFAYFFYNTKQISISNSIFKSGLKAFIFSDSSYQCNHPIGTDDYIIGCHYSQFEFIIDKKSATQNCIIESSSFFNCSCSKIMFFFHSETSGHYFLKFDNCCFYNLFSTNYIIQADSQCNIYRTTFIKNIVNNIYVCMIQSSMISNNISYNILYDPNKLEKTELICFYGVTDAINFDIQYNTFAYNDNSPYLINYYKYGSSSLTSSAFINNSLGYYLILLTSSSETVDIDYFSISKCSFYKNFNYKKMENLKIFSTTPDDAKVTVFGCLVDSALPLIQANYFYLNNNLSYDFNLSDGNIWNIKNVYSVSTPEPSNGFNCVINSRNIPSPSPTTAISQTSTVSQSYTSSTIYNSTNISIEPSIDIFSSYISSSESILISPTSIEIFTSTVLAKEKKTKTGLICGILFSLIAIIVIIIIILFLYKTHKLCFKKNTSSFFIDMMQSNAPIVESNQEDIMSGKENVFDKITHKDAFDYSLVV